MRVTQNLKTPNAAAGLSNGKEKLTNSEASRMCFSDGTLSAVTYALLLGITCLTVLCDLTNGSSDFSGGGNIIVCLNSGGEITTSVFSWL